jgi:hypothetical protein
MDKDNILMTNHASMNDGDPADIVCETDNGCVTRCTSCTMVYLEFGNFILKLDPKKFRALKSFMYSLDYEMAETANAFFNLRRRIIIRIEKTNVMLVLNRDECIELVDLLQLAEICLGSDPLWRDSDFTQN